MAAASPKRRILLVDDDDDFLDLLSMWLGKKYELDVAHDGEEALAQVGKVPPDLVLLDVMMPRLGGASVCWTLKNHERYRGIPILILTAYASTPEKQLERADGHLFKPFDLASLEGKIEELLERLPPPRPAAG